MIGVQDIAQPGVFGIDTWLLGFGALHVVIGAILAWRHPEQPAFGVWLVAIAGALLAGGLAERLDGSALVVAWLVEAVALIWLGAATRDDRAHVVAGALALFAVAMALEPTPLLADCSTAPSISCPPC